jgi:hypothetical protein
MRRLATATLLNIRIPPRANKKPGGIQVNLNPSRRGDAPGDLAPSPLAVVCRIISAEEFEYYSEVNRSVKLRLAKR